MKLQRTLVIMTFILFLGNSTAFGLESTGVDDRATGSAQTVTQANVGQTYYEGTIDSAAPDTLVLRQAASPASVPLAGDAAALQTPSQVCQSCANLPGVGRNLPMAEAVGNALQNALMPATICEQDMPGVLRAENSFSSTLIYFDVTTRMITKTSVLTQPDVPGGNVKETEYRGGQGQINQVTHSFDVNSASSDYDVVVSTQVQPASEGRVATSSYQVTENDPALTRTQTFTPDLLQSAVETYNGQNYARSVCDLEQSICELKTQIETHQSESTRMMPDDRSMTFSQYLETNEKLFSAERSLYVVTGNQELLGDMEAHAKASGYAGAVVSAASAYVNAGMIEKGEALLAESFNYNTYSLASDNDESYGVALGRYHLQYQIDQKKNL